MKIIRLSLCALALLVSFSSTVMAAPSRSVETAGTLTSNQDGQIAGNVWAGLSRDEALLLINALPARYATPTWYDVARRLLLSDAPGLPEGNRPKDAPATDPSRPDILIARLDKLMEMGALRDAEMLYDTVVGEFPDNFDLAYRSLQILMLRGQLSAACLDLQAMQATHGKNPKWVELNRLCRVQFAQGGERARILNETKFDYYPAVGNFLRGRAPNNLSAMNTEELAFAVATGLVNENTARSMTSKAGKLPPLLLTVLFSIDAENAMPERTCLGIEAARRGLASTRDLISLYEAPHYASDLLLSPGMPALGGMHPCLAPTVMYQRIASAKENPAQRNSTIRQALDLMSDLPDAAFWPMATYFKDFDVHAAQNKKYVWRLTRIVAYEKDELPQDWARGWGGQGGAGVSPFWPVQAIVSPEGDSMDELNIWRQQWPSEAKRVASRDPIIPLLLGQSLNPGPKTGKNDKTKLRDYENNLSLTFSRTYSMPSYGLTQRLNDVIKNNQTGQSVALLLIGYGAIPPDQVIPHQMALVIEGLNKAGLGRYARRFALEVLR